MLKNLHFIIFFLLLVGCKKKVEVIKEVPVEKKNSWSEVKGFTGTQKIMLSSGSSSSAIYLQQPFFFSEVRNADPNNGITTYGAALPTDVYLRIPVSARFHAYPLGFKPTVLIVRHNLRPNASPSGGAYDLKELDSTATGIQSYFLSLFKCMAINKNDFLLFSYTNNRPGSPFTLCLFSIKATIAYPYIDTFYTKRIVIPKTSVSGYVRYIQAVDDYFLVEIGDEGIYKIRQDGSLTKVFSDRIVDAFYEWNGKVYGNVEWGKILVSANKSESFEEFTGVDDVMTLSNYYQIKDSLVGANHDNLFTLKWANTNYTIRPIKSDGLEGTVINGLEVLRDSIYAVTTSGLFVKPLSKFFETN